MQIVSRILRILQQMICRVIIISFVLKNKLIGKFQVRYNQLLTSLNKTQKEYLKILLVNAKWDCAGVSISLCNAINNYTKHSARHIVKVETNLKYETDITAQNYRTKDILSILKTIDEADIIHFNYVDHSTPFFNIEWTDFINGKKIIFHDHSGWEPYKDLHDEYISGQLFNKYDNYDQVIVCAPSDINIFNKGIWLPNIMPIDQEDYLPIYDRSYESTLIIGQTAASPQIKSTDILERVANEMREGGYDVQLDIITGVSHAECLRRKREHHIEFDNMYQGHHGMAGLESISMGIPTLAWLKPDVVEAYKRLGEGNDVPFINVQDENELKANLIELVENRKLLREKSIYCRKWIETYYSEERLVNMYIDLYERIMAN